MWRGLSRGFRLAPKHQLIVDIWSAKAWRRKSAAVSGGMGSNARTSTFKWLRVPSGQMAERRGTQSPGAKRFPKASETPNRTTGHRLPGQRTFPIRKCPVRPDMRDAFSVMTKPDMSGNCPALSGFVLKNFETASRQTRRHNARPSLSFRQPGQLRWC